VYIFGVMGTEIKTKIQTLCENPIIYVGSCFERIKRD